MTRRVLLVDDDCAVGQPIVNALQGAGFEPVWWQQGRAIDAAWATGLSLVILELALPGVYGLDILKQLRADGAEVPVMLLSKRGDPALKVRAFELGADDYLTKPCAIEELIERVRARVRRPSLRRTETVEVGPLRVDLSTRVAAVDDTAVELTRVEFELLAALARRPGMALTRHWLVDNVLDPDRAGCARTLDVHVSRLRKKLGRGVRLETVWGVGYRLERAA